MSKISYFTPQITKEDINKVSKTLSSKWISTGQEVLKLEKDFSKNLKVNHNKCVAVSSGFSALHLACHLAGIKSEDEVLIQTINFVAIANILKNLDAKIKFVDCESKTNPNISVEDLEKKISEKTKVVVTMHYGGYPCDMKKILQLQRKYKFCLIEDACHAIFSSYSKKKLGSFGNFSSFSFYANKNMTCGEGGMLYCRSIRNAKRARFLKTHGLNRTSLSHYKNLQNKYEVNEAGFNYRLDEIRAALARSQLNRIKKNNLMRHKIFKKYNKHLKKNNRINIAFSKYTKNNFSRHLYVIISNNKKKIIRALNKNRIGHSNHYKPIHKLIAHKKKLKMKNSDYIDNKIISLPIYPGLGLKKVEKICKIINLC
jgi:dTDP-4-amino-4,6-dideoxygalactose transaminase